MTFHPIRTLAGARALACLARADERPGQVSYETWVKTHAARMGVAVGLIRSPAELAPEAAPAVAYLNHGEWLADCPDGCGEASLVEPGWSYMCAGCGNVLLGGQWRRVKWPTGVLRAAVEREIAERPFNRTRSWNRGERLVELRRENADHDLPAHGPTVRADEIDPTIPAVPIVEAIEAPEPVQRGGLLGRKESLAA